MAAFSDWKKILIGLFFLFSVLFLISFLGSSPEGVNDLCFHTCGEFSPPPPPPIRTVFWPKSYPKGPNPSLKAQITALRSNSHP